MGLAGCVALFQDSPAFIGVWLRGSLLCAFTQRVTTYQVKNTTSSAFALHFIGVNKSSVECPISLQFSNEVVP